MPPGTRKCLNQEDRYTQIYAAAPVTMYFSAQWIASFCLTSGQACLRARTGRQKHPVNPVNPGLPGVVLTKPGQKKTEY